MFAICVTRKKSWLSFGNKSISYRDKHCYDKQTIRLFIQNKAVSKHFTDFRATFEHSDRPKKKFRKTTRQTTLMFTQFCSSRVKMTLPKLLRETLYPCHQSNSENNLMPVNRECWMLFSTDASRRHD